MFNQHVAKLLSAYCHHELPADEIQRVQTHLQACAQCRAEYETIKSLDIFLQQNLSTIAAPESLWFAVVKGNFAPKNIFAAILNWRFAASATAILIFGLVGWFGVARLLQKTTPTIAPQKNIVVAQHDAVIAPTIAPSPFATKQAKTPETKPQPAPDLSAKNVRKNSAAPAWEVATVQGTPSIGATKINGTEKIAVGEWLETDNESRAKIKVADIGFVDINPNSQVQLVKSGSNEHRIALKKGKLSAFIIAPPRLFVVDTPSATAVDLGCAYTLEVDEIGNSLLHVTSGWVSFVLHGRESFIPAGAMCATRKDEGVGTPYFANASASLQAALQQLDFAKNAAPFVLIKTICAEAKTKDALTLWHLLNQTKWQSELRAEIYDRLAELIPPPSGITRAGILQGNRQMLDRWWQIKIQ